MSKYTELILKDEDYEILEINERVHYDIMSDDEANDLYVLTKGVLDRLEEFTVIIK